MVKIADKKSQRNEKRRKKLEWLINEKCDGNNAALARRIGKDPSYINRCLYPEGKEGKKNIGDEIMDSCIDAFELLEDFWVRSDEEQLIRVDTSTASMEKIQHIQDVIEMDNEEFKKQEGVFAAVVKTAKDRKMPD